jgi:hypothetical protein
MKDDRVFPVSTIAQATLSYRLGCAEQKIAFLQDAFGIDAMDFLVGTEPRHFDLDIHVKVIVKPDQIDRDELDQWYDDGGCLTVEQWIIDRFEAQNLADRVPGLDILTGYDVDVREVTEDGEPIFEPVDEPMFEVVGAVVVDVNDPTVTLMGDEVQ